MSESGRVYPISSQIDRLVPLNEIVSMESMYFDKLLDILKRIYN